MFSRKSPRPLFVTVALAAFAGAGATASPAAAYTCSASALKGTVLTQSGIEPVVAGGNGCATDKASLTSLPAPLSGVAGANTELLGPAGSPMEQKALAQAGVENLTVGALRSLPVSLPAAQMPSGLGAIDVPLPGGLLGLPSVITVDARKAAADIVPVRQLPDVALATIRSLRSAVGGQCLNGLVDLAGAAVVDGLSLLGESLPTDAPVDRAVTLLGEQTIPLSGIDVSAVQLPAGLSFDNPITGAALRTAVRSAIAGLPPIVLPPTVGQVETTPNQQIAQDGSLEQRALRMKVSVAGQNVADLVLGIARIATDGLSCEAVKTAVKPPAMEEVVEEVAVPIAPASQLAVSCAKASLTLIDVLDKGDFVAMHGAADKKLIGKRVRIISMWNGKQVATSKVGRSGFFNAFAAVPPKSLRHTSRARYMAVASGEKSLPLKLHRRMRFSSLTKQGKTIRLRGRVYGPMTNEVIEIRQRVSCTKDVVVKRIKPNANGRWTAVVKAPKGTKAATYRATTQVRNSGSGRKFPTFTLPGYVSL